MTEFCDQVSSTYLSTTAQHIKTLNRSLVQIYTLCGFSLSFFEIITQPRPLWRQSAATSSAGTEQNLEQPSSGFQPAQEPPSGLSLGEPGGSCRQTPLGNELDCHRGGACAALGHLGSVLETELLKIWGPTATRASTTITPMSHLTDQWAYTPCEADTHWNPPKEPASCTPLLSLGNYFNPTAPVSQPNILLWSLDYITGSVCKTSTNKFWCCPLFQTSFQ